METEKEYPAFDKQFEKIDIALEALDGLKEKLGLEHYFKFDYELSILKELVQHTHDSLPFKVGEYVKISDGVKIYDEYHRERLERGAVMEITNLYFKPETRHGEDDRPAKWMATAKLVYHRQVEHYTVDQYRKDDDDLRVRYHQDAEHMTLSLSAIEKVSRADYDRWLREDADLALKRYNEHRDEIFSKQRQCKSCGRSCTCGGK